MLDLLESGLLFGAETFVETHHIKFAKKLTRATFSPLKVLKMADKAQQGGFNISGADCFRAIQSLKNTNAASCFQSCPSQRQQRSLKMKLQR